MMIETSIPRVLIPASGFGKRAGRPESKEMAINPATEEPLIAAALHIARERGWPVTVLTRSEKHGLLDYLSSHRAVDVMITLETRDWPETLAHSRERWNDLNLVLLPDTEFEPIAAVDLVVEALKSSSDIAAAFGVFEVTSPKTWGMVVTSDRQASTEICEKPFSSQDNAKAWGLFGFRREVGEELFRNLLESSFDHKWKKLGFRSKAVRLDSFRDLTRTR